MSSPTTARLRVPDPEHRFRSVRLKADLPIPDDHVSFRWVQGVWTLAFPRPAADRVEYLLEVTQADGRVETVPDPANPLRVDGGFGDRSVLELPGYRRPHWLSLPAPEGRLCALGAAQVWQPHGLPPDRAAPVLVVHDGPEYVRLGAFTAYLASLIADGELPPLRAALLHSPDRNREYSVDSSYNRWLATTLLPRLRAAIPTAQVIGVGASLGALAHLSTHRRYPESFDGLFLQSGSFFHPDYDSHESGFRYYRRMVRWVQGVHRSATHPRPVPVAMTCGTVEENLANNRRMARALAAQGYDLTFTENRDAHTYTGWRDALHPALTELVLKVCRA